MVSRLLADPEAPGTVSLSALWLLQEGMGTDATDAASGLSINLAMLQGPLYVTHLFPSDPWLLLAHWKWRARLCPPGGRPPAWQQVAEAQGRGLRPARGLSWVL